MKDEQTIVQKLAEVQRKLKAPKGQFNSFGKYNYRNCEDILQAVKPLLKDAVILLDDKVVVKGDRYYIKATATFSDGIQFPPVSVHAYAREDENKKGMDASQLSGSTSSYARKYALNGLLLIDDNKDADVTNVFADEADEYEELLSDQASVDKAGEGRSRVFEIYMFTQARELEERSLIWKAYKAKHVPAGKITAVRAKIGAWNEAGREEALKAKAEGTMADYNEDQIAFINTLTRGETE